MDRLPMEVINHIISFLDLCDQLPLSAVSLRWRAAVSDCLRRRRRLDWEELHRWTRERRIQNRLTDAQLRALLPRLPALRELDLTNLRGVKYDIDIVSEICPHLEKLNLSTFRLDTDSLERLCRRCPRLWDVRMPNLESDLLELLLYRLPGVRVLRLEDMTVSKNAELLFPDGLERLELYACQLTGSLWLKPDRWPRLTELVLRHASGPADGMAALVQGCPRLQSLVADWSDAEDTLLRVLPALPLRHLNIASCTEMTEDGLASCLGRLRQLESLDISYLDSVTDRVLDSLAGAESLRELTVGEYVDIDHIDHSPMEFSMEALRRLVVTSPSLMMVHFNLLDKRMEQLESSITSLQLLLANKKQGAIP